MSPARTQQIHGLLSRVVDVSQERFEELVSEALDGIPPQFTKAMRNVAVFVEDVPDDPNLLGLYVGIPLTARTTSYAGVLPDRIMIYRSTICGICATEADVVAEVRKTVVHEVAHHFGIDDDRLHELGY
jgi:predicted Zn-dependent protease with MMP-like domain